MLDRSRSQVLFVYYNPHPSHKAFADSIEADFWSYNRYVNHNIYPKMMKSFINGLLIPDYDVYLTEGGAPLIPVAIKKLASINKSRNALKNVNLISDHTFIMMEHTPKEMSGQYGSLTNFAHKFASKYIDGAIAVSNFAKETAELFIDGPIRVAHPFIEEDLYQRLSSLAPKLQKNMIMSVGSGTYKGMDILVDAFKKVRNEVPDSELYIIGGGHPERWNETKGVHVEGHVSDLIPYFKSASLFVQPSRADTFPVSSLESLRAGVPTMVTEKTGTKEVVSALGTEFVRRVDQDDIAEGILRYFDLEEEKRLALSNKAKIISKKFNKAEMCARFKSEFEALLHEI